MTDKIKQRRIIKIAVDENKYHRYSVFLQNIGFNLENIEPINDNIYHLYTHGIKNTDFICVCYRPNTLFTIKIKMYIDDMICFKEKLLKNNIKIQYENHFSDGESQLIINDPDGNVWTFVKNPENKVFVNEQIDLEIQSYLDKYDRGEPVERLKSRYDHDKYSNKISIAMIEILRIYKSNSYNRSYFHDMRDKFVVYSICRKLKHNLKEDRIFKLLNLNDEMFAIAFYQAIDIYIYGPEKYIHIYRTLDLIVIKFSRKGEIVGL